MNGGRETSYSRVNRCDGEYEGQNIETVLQSEKI